jgi:hypothetical protein
MINLLRLKLNKKYYRKDEVDALFKELNNKIDNLNILSKEEIQDIIDSNTFYGLEAIAKFTFWKKTTEMRW